MKPQIKIILSLLTFLIYVGFLGIYNAYQSPIAATANAQQLNDNLPLYGWSRFVANDGIPHTAFWLFIVTLAIIWISSIFKLVKSK